MEQTTDTKERLIEVATRLMWERSYGTVSVDKICKRAEVNKGSFYHFFPSKEALALEALDRNWKTSKEMIFEPSFRKELSPLERFSRFFENFYTVQSEMKRECGGVLGCPIGNLASEVGVDDETLRKKAQEIYTELCAIFEEALCDGVEQGVITDIDPPLLAKILVAYQAGLVLQAKVYNDVDLLRLLSSGMAQLIGVKEKDGRLISPASC